MIDIQSVLGAICIYVFIGMFFAAVFQAIGNLGSAVLLRPQKTATLADYLYFSFVTQTTVGYGDLTAAGGLGRAVAALEGLTGQVYLVTVVAMLVSQVAVAKPWESEPRLLAVTKDDEGRELRDLSPACSTPASVPTPGQARGRSCRTTWAAARRWRDPGVAICEPATPKPPTLRPHSPRHQRGPRAGLRPRRQAVG